MADSGTEIRILHLEDDPADAELIQRELRRAGLNVSPWRVETEEAFRAALGGAPPDVILADYRLPSFDGLSALHIAQALISDVPFIFVTGSLGEERAVEALREGAVDYILKDRPSRLPAAITRALREREEQLARARAEQAVIESERRYRYAAKATRDVIWDHDLAAGKIHVHDSMLAYWGHAGADVDVAWWLERVHPHDRQPVLGSYERWLGSHDERWTAEFRFRRGDGSYGYAVQHALMLRGPDGKPVRVIGAMQDVTESRRLQEQLDRAQRVESLGRVAATIAHEFNNVLMGIQPAAEVIGRAADERTRRMAANILESVGRGRRIVDEILQMTRIPDPVMEVFDVAALLQQLQDEISAISGPAVRVDLELPGRQACIRGDRAQLQQVLVNMVVNARDAMPGGGTLTLRVSADDEQVVVTVADTGDGMAPEVLDHIFEPLFTTKKTGTGLGLAVSHRLLQQNGAEVAVESAPGLGTTFRITFAAHRDGPDATGESQAVRPASHRRVLVVEDDASVAEGVSLLLETEGFETRVIDQGRDVVGEVETWTPDVVLLDVSLRDIPGTAVYDALHARWPRLPVVFTSGHIEVPRLGDRGDSEHVAFVRKPFSLDALLACIERVSASQGEGGAVVSQ